MKEGNYTPLLTAIPTCDFQSKFCQISSYFAYLFYIMNKCQKLKVVLDEVFIDEFSNFDPDIADSLSNLSKQVSKTSQQDENSRQFSHTFRCFKFTTFEFDRVVTRQMFPFLSF